MKRVAAVVAGCVAVAAVVLWVTFFRDSDEERIRRVLVELTKVVAVKEGDTLLSRTARLRSRMKDIVEDDVRVNVAELGADLRGRHKLEDDAARIGVMYARADCELTRLDIRVDPQGSLAQVDAVALVTGMRGGERNVDRGAGGSPSPMSRDVHFLLRRDGDWKISTIDVAPKKED